MSLRDAWETRASDWVRWARSPELDDDFWRFHLPEFVRFVPAPGRLTVDVGCGEGRLGRVLTSSGHRVVGFDTSLTSVRAAATHPEGHPVAIADAVRLPLPDDVADVAIAFMSLHDFDDVCAAVAEVARVLSPKPGSHETGRLVSNHPQRQATSARGSASLWSSSPSPTAG
jgi:ubiquinone/menaquinone biosynthesis C-methylase UbiE